jgi:hypothetical protein
MDRNTAQNIRRVLASNLNTFAARARNNRSQPFSYSIESLQNHCSRCVAEANFCFMIDAIDGDSYIVTRNTIMDLTAAVIAVRKAVKDNHDVGATSAEATKKINLLYSIVFLLKCGDSTPAATA